MFVAIVNPSQPDQIGQRLIDQASQLLTEHGTAGLSLRKVAAAAGTSTMSVYTRFGSKEQLLAAMYREGFRRLGQSLDHARTNSADGLSGLRAIGLAYRQAALASPRLYGLMFGPPPPGLTPSAEDAAAARATYQPLAEGVRNGVQAGLLTGDPDRIAQHLWAVAHGMISLELAGMLPTQNPDNDFAQALSYAVTPFLASEPESSAR